jgi:transposase-like protein
MDPHRSAAAPAARHSQPATKSHIACGLPGADWRLHGAIALVRDRGVSPSVAACACVVELGQLQDALRACGVDVSAAEARLAETGLQQAVVLFLDEGFTVETAAVIAGVRRHQLLGELKARGLRPNRHCTACHPNDPQLRVVFARSRAGQAACVQALQSGRTLSATAGNLGVSENSVRRALRAAGVGPLKAGRPPKNPEQVPVAVRLVLEAGYTVKRACEELGVAREPLQAALKLASQRLGHAEPHEAAVEA